MILIVRLAFWQPRLCCAYLLPLVHFQDIDDDSDDDIPELEEQVGGDDSAEVRFFCLRFGWDIYTRLSMTSSMLYKYDEDHTFTTVSCCRYHMSGVLLFVPS